MAVTLLEAAKQMRGEDVRRGVIEVFASSNPLLMALPFDTITGSAISFTREDTPGAVEFRSINSAYTEGSGTFSKVTEPLAICGGDLDVDRFIVETHGQEIRAQQEAMKAKRLGALFAKKFIKGDQTSDANEFFGLQARLTGSDQMVTQSAGALSLLKLDEAIHKVDNPTHIIMNKTLARRWMAAVRPSGSSLPVAGDVLSGTGPGAIGYRPLDYAGLPFIVVDDNADVYTDVLPFTEASTSTSVYVISLQEGMLTGIQSSAPMVDDLGMIDTKPVYRTRMEWYAGLCMWHPRAAARYELITDVAIAA